MNILILSNNAPNYYKFFNLLASKLSSENHKVEICTDSDYTLDQNEIPNTNLKYYVFSQFWNKNSKRDRSFIDKYANQPINQTLLSDFERSEVFIFNQLKDLNYYKSLQVSILHFFESILTDSKIDLVVYENVSNAFAYACWLVCKRLGIAYVGLIGSRLPGRFSVVDDPHGEYKIYSDLLDKIQSSEIQVSESVRNWCLEYLENLDQSQPDYMKFNNLDNTSIFSKYFRLSKFKKLIVAFRHRNDDHAFAFQVGNPLNLAWQMFLRSFKRKLRLRSCFKLYEKPVQGERFLLYPLHFHPESSTSVAAPAYLDEYEVIRNIAFSLPVDTLLYVKDHISAFGLQPISFYKRLASLPNVRLLGPKENTKQLIRDSIGVVTLTSTVGYEALLLNRRVFLYGSVFYEFHPNVVKVENPSKLFELFLTHLDAPLPADSKYNEDFLAAYYLGTYPGILNFFLDDRSTEKLVDDLFPQLMRIFEDRVKLNTALQK